MTGPRLDPYEVLDWVLHAAYPDLDDHLGVIKIGDTREAREHCKAMLAALGITPGDGEPGGQR